MPKQTVFVISILGQDEFWNGGGTSSDINSVIIYNNFKSAEADLADASAVLEPEWGPAGLEIRQMIYTY